MVGNHLLKVLVPRIRVQREIKLCSAESRGNLFLPLMFSTGVMELCVTLQPFHRAAECRGQHQAALMEMHMSLAANFPNLLAV